MSFPTYRASPRTVGGLSGRWVWHFPAGPSLTNLSLDPEIEDLAPQSPIGGAGTAVSLRGVCLRVCPPTTGFALKIPRQIHPSSCYSEGVSAHQPVGGMEKCTWTLKLPIKIGYHPIILGVKPILKGILRVQVCPPTSRGASPRKSIAGCFLSRSELLRPRAPSGPCAPPGCRPSPAEAQGLAWRLFLAQQLEPSKLLKLPFGNCPSARRVCVFVRCVLAWTKSIVVGLKAKTNKGRPLRPLWRVPFLTKKAETHPTPCAESESQQPRRSTRLQDPGRHIPGEPDAQHALVPEGIAHLGPHAKRVLWKPKRRKKRSHFLPKNKCLGCQPSNGMIWNHLFRIFPQRKGTSTTLHLLPPFVRPFK